MRDIISSIGFPRETEVGRTLFKKMFYENANLSKQEKDLLMNQIDKVLITHNLNPQNINIMPFEDTTKEYHAIQVIEVRIHAKDKPKKIAEMIIGAIPMPVILQLKFEEVYMLALGLRVFDDKDKDKTKIEEWIFSKWIDSNNLSEKESTFLEEIHIKRLSYSNFYRFYLSLIGKINCYNASFLTEKYIQNIDGEEVKRIYEAIENYDSEIQKLRGKLKKESQFNKKVELNVKIKQLQQKREELIKQLNGGTTNE